MVLLHILCWRWCLHLDALGTRIQSTRAADSTFKRTSWSVYHIKCPSILSIFCSMLCVCVWLCASHEVNCVLCCANASRVTEFEPEECDSLVGISWDWHWGTLTKSLLVPCTWLGVPCAKVITLTYPMSFTQGWNRLYNNCNKFQHFHRKEAWTLKLKPRKNRT